MQTLKLLIPYEIEILLQGIYHDKNWTSVNIYDYNVCYYSHAYILS